MVAFTDSRKKKKKKSRFFNQWALRRELVQTESGGVNKARLQLTNIRTKKLVSEEAVHAGCQSDCVNARPLPAGAMMDERWVGGGLAAPSAWPFAAAAAAAAVQHHKNVKKKQ